LFDAAQRADHTLRTRVIFHWVIPADAGIFGWLKVKSAWKTTPGFARQLASW
jgi:hypothetical protein